MEFQKARDIEAVELQGRTVKLRPLQMTDAEALYQTLGLSHVDTWKYMIEQVPKNYEEFAEMIKSKVDSTDRFYFVILVKQIPVGICALMRYNKKNGVIEIGNILCSDALKRTTASTEMHYLLMKYVFETLGIRRYEWKCDSINENSKRAALRLGFTYEGCFRQHMIYKHRNRDTAWFSIIDGEWPKQKKRFERWLAIENFNEDGKQKIKLEEI